MTCFPSVEAFGDVIPTHVHRHLAFAEVAPVPHEAPSIDSFLRRELDLDEGTPEWRAWLARAAGRHGVPLAVT